MIPKTTPTAFALVRAYVGAPVGIEPTTPSLPSMRGRFTTPHRTLRPHTTAQVRAAVGGCVVGRHEVACSAVSGKSLASAPAWSAVAQRRRHRPGSPRRQANALAVHRCPLADGWCAVALAAPACTQRVPPASGPVRPRSPRGHDLSRPSPRTGPGGACVSARARVRGMEVLPPAAVLAPPQAQPSSEQPLDQAISPQPGTQVGGAGRGEPTGQ
jgi:hypothetical protein